MDEVDEINGLLRRRNRCVVAALLVILVPFLVCLPRSLARRAALKSLNSELLELQASIVVEQTKTREIQQQIIATQAEIKLNQNASGTSR